VVVVEPVEHCQAFKGGDGVVALHHFSIGRDLLEQEAEVAGARGPASTETRSPKRYRIFRDCSAGQPETADKIARSSLSSADRSLECGVRSREHLAQYLEQDYGS
jgi:hypothetical protein